MATDREQGTGSEASEGPQLSREQVPQPGLWRGVLGTLLLLLSACSSPAPQGERAAAADSVVAVDDVGREVALPRPARRVLSLLPAGTATFVALGAGDLVVGRTRYDEDPSVAHLPSVGGGLDPSLEALVALRPELVVAWEAPTGSPLRARLEEMGIPVFAIATRDTAAIFRNILNLGHLTGRDAAADSLARHLRAQLAEVHASVPPGPRPSVLYVVSIDPPMIAGTDNFLAELIEVAGGVPLQISGPQKGLSPQVSLEELLRRQPDVVVLPVGADSSASLARLHREPGWRDLQAVREGRVAVVPADLMNRPGPTLGEAAARLRQALRAAWEPR